MIDGRRKENSKKTKRGFLQECSAADAYKKTEEISMNIASKTFNKKFIYKENNLDQKKISLSSS